MTKSQVDGTTLVVVDGSNIATEGRSVPSLAQLNDAVLALTSEFPEITVTVVVDATFGHRIDKSEVSEFDEAVAHNELVTPPAGAIGRGDAFVLSIANKVGARIFSNDSFQEFHGVYPWLFDEGRLIGGKPVPHVGWVFVNRVPVKGPVSRKARSSKDGAGSRRAASKLASLPMPIPTSPPPGRVAAKDVAVAAATPSAGSGRGRRRKSDDAAMAGPVPATGKDAAPPTPVASPPSGGPVNDLLPFLDFVQHHPVGTAVMADVETYSSHGAYVKIGDVRGYVPLRLMGSPPPRSAREVMRLGDLVSLVVASFAPPRRSIDLAVPGVVDVVPPAEAPAPKRRASKAAAAPVAEARPAASAPAPGAGEPTESKRRRRGKPAEQPAAEELAAIPVAPDVDGQPAAPAKPAARSGRRSKATTGPVHAESSTPTPARSKRAAATSDGSAEPAPTPPAKKSAAAAKKSTAKKSSGTKPVAIDTASADGPATTATPAKKGRASKTAAPGAAAGADASSSPKPRAAKKAAATSGAATVDGAGAATEPASRRRRSKASAGD